MNGSVRSSAGLLWRHQRLVWWVFVVNLITAWLGSLPARATLSAVLDHSLESAKLVTGFDVSTLVLMAERPDVSPRSLAPSAVAVAVVFLIYLLFIDGGVMTVFLDDKKLSRAEFFENSGLFFWRMVRLTLYSMLPFGLLAAAHSALSGYAGQLSNDAPQDRLGFFVHVSGSFLLLVIALFVRMTFDLAQSQIVRDNDRGVLRVLTHRFRIAWHSRKLFAEYVGIGFFAVATFGIGMGVWVYLPHSAILASFVVLELVTLAQIASRLWMKAASGRWLSLFTSDVASSPLPENETPAPVIEVTNLRPPLPE